MTLTLVAVLATTTTLAGTAAAQNQKAAAEALYGEGRNLMSSGNYADACAKFEASQRLDPASGTQLNLAHCLEKLGKTASAWAEYKEAAAAARAAVEASRVELAEKGASSLEAGLSKIRINADPTPGLEVHLDGVALSGGSLNSDLPIDPGDHTLEGVAPGRVPYRTKITIGPNGDKKAVKIPALAVDPSAAASPSPVTSPGTTPAPAPHTDSGWSTQRTAGVVVGAVGLVGVVVGAVFGANAVSKNNAAQTHCIGGDDAHCDSQAGSLTSDAKTAGTISTIAFVVGGVGIVGGTIMFVTGGRSNSSTKGSTTGLAVDLHPIVARDSGGLALRGTW